MENYKYMHFGIVNLRYVIDYLVLALVISKMFSNISLDFE